MNSLILVATPDESFTITLKAAHFSSAIQYFGASSNCKLHVLLLKDIPNTFTRPLRFSRRGNSILEGTVSTGDVFANLATYNSVSPRLTI